MCIHETHTLLMKHGSHLGTRTSSYSSYGTEGESKRHIAVGKQEDGDEAQTSVPDCSDLLCKCEYIIIYDESFELIESARRFYHISVVDTHTS